MSMLFLDVCHNFIYLLLIVNAIVTKNSKSYLFYFCHFSLFNFSARRVGHLATAIHRKGCRGIILDIAVDLYNITCPF